MNEQIGLNHLFSASAQRRLNRIAQEAVLAALLMLAIYFRFNALALNPGWYADEGSDLNIARNLQEGRLQYFAVYGTPLVAARPPLFHLLLIAGFQIGGYDISTARGVAAISNLLTIVLLWLTARAVGGDRFALLAAFALAIMPNALLYNRLALAYNLQMPLVIVCWWSLHNLIKARQPRWLWLASLVAAAAYMIALTGLGLVVLVALIAWRYVRRQWVWSFVLMALPGLLYLGLLALFAPTYLMPDLALTFTRSSESLLVQLVYIIANYTSWFEWSPWIVIGSIGLFLIESRTWRLLSLSLCALMLINVLRTFPPGDLNFHRFLGALPLVAVGVAQFCVSAYRWLVTQFQRDFAVIRLPPVSARFITLALIAAPFLWASMSDIYFVSSVQSPLATRLDYVLARKPTDALAVTDFINANAQPDDLVLASPALVWRIHAHAADFEQALAYQGEYTLNYAEGLPRERFAFDPSIDKATFIILDPIWRNWAAEVMPALKPYIVEIETWTRVLHRGDYDVYRNPAR